MKEIISSAAPLAQTLNEVTPDTATIVLGIVAVVAIYKLVDKAMDLGYEVNVSGDAERQNFNVSLNPGKVSATTS